MNLIEEIFGRPKHHRRIQSLVVIAFCCCGCINGFAQLNYLTDTRSISGSASIDASGLPTPPYYTISYSGYSGSTTSAPFADFAGSASGTATYVGGFSNPITGKLSSFTDFSSLFATQISVLHPQQLFFASTNLGLSSSTSSSGYSWTATGSSSLKVSFSVSSSVTYNLILEGLGDPLASYGSYNLSSADQGVLVSGNTQILAESGLFGYPVEYSGTFDPGDVYTLTLASQGGAIGSGPSLLGPDGGGFIADLVVPEPSMTALTGLAFLIFLLRPNRIGQRGSQPPRPSAPSNARSRE